MLNKEYIIFDLGGVVLNLDYNLTSKAFQQLGLTNFDEIYAQAAQTELFDSFEIGKISPQFFINGLLPYLPVGTTPNQVVHAWNAMILDFPIARLAFLEQLKQTKKVYLLSNTNEIHIQAVNRSLQAVTHHSLDYFFDKVYLSHEVNMRKPHAEIFEFVCRDIGIMPQEALFIDDTIRHVEGAKKVGLVAHHLHQQDIVELGLI